ncbi:sensor histidine kinase [Phycicoccus sonneratiae]|uniref:histidine kinase n=1 Tax=Phycicoccus sonneratiae TaxID=2807628 RepID=A0ABS2CHN6_9MICO|nr:histidine kinase [Phycicoccus sonneraticus]MBM6399295.1 hypothetical protein [Phycicoccus sonneraticus]
MRPTRGDLVTAAVCACVAAVLAVVGRYGVAELVFFTVMLGALAFTVRSGVRAWRRERAARRDAAALARVRPEQVAADAVREERQRLSHDIAAELRTMLRAVGEEAARVEDPAVAARRIHRQARLASTELRRLLGLLRTLEVEPAADAAADDDVTPRRPPGRDLALGAGSGALALVESLTYPRAEGLGTDPLAVAVTVAVATTVAGRTRSPVGAAVTAALLTGAGSVSGHALVGGFWMLLTLTGLVWATVAPPGTSPRRTGAGVLLAGVVCAAAWRDDHGNAVVTTAVVATVVAVGVAVRVARSRAERSDRVAAGLRADLDEATSAALDADRAAFAREIHDAVSHAVGLIAVQAGAAEVSAAADPEAARRSLRLVADAAADALADLDRLDPDAERGRRSAADLVALVDRIRAAGTPVATVGLDVVPPAHADVVYRVVQEALTNVVRHGAGASARVCVDVSGPGTTVTVSDEGPGRSPSARRGFGLVGLGERVRHAGGRLHTGTGSGGTGFVVEATLPRSRAEVA